jgi:tight adherence protein B
LGPEAAALAAGALGGWCLGELARALLGLVGGAGPAARTVLASLSEPLMAAGAGGVGPDRSEQRRLMLAGALAGSVLGLMLAGLPGAAAGAQAGILPMNRVLRARRLRYRRAVNAGASEIATAMADAVAGGSSVRGAVRVAAGLISGPPGAELRRAAADMDLGSPTDDCLDQLRARSGSPEIDAIVTAAKLQRRAGGDLARLLRDLARGFEDQARVQGEVRAATAQARFTGIIVILLPVAGTGMAELAAPGFLAGLVRDPLSSWLIGLGVALQVAAALAIRRLARVRA